MTTTINSQLMSIGKLLTGDDCSYSVRSYQRDYSWTEIEVEQFWNDVINTIDEGRSEYFFGAIVIKFLQQNLTNSNILPEKNERDEQRRKRRLLRYNQ